MFEDNPILFTLFLLAGGYLVGSISFSWLLVKLLKGQDIRASGSGHATTTNTIRQAGFAAGALILVLDISKGFIPAAAAIRLGAPGWAVGLAAAAAVAGHCWPIFFGFRGGMGLAASGGGYLAASWLSFTIMIGLLVALTLTIRHGARASFIAGLAGLPVLWLFGMRGDVLWIAVCTGVVLAIRFTIDWRREYRELWLDREQPGSS